MSANLRFPQGILSFILVPFLRPVWTSGELQCRVSSIPYWLGASSFRSYACGECFYFTYAFSLSEYFFHRCVGGILVCESKNSPGCDCQNKERVFNFPEYDLFNQSTHFDSIPITTPPHPGYLEHVKACCEAAVECCENVIGSNATAVADLRIRKTQSEECPGTWDGWHCFPPTPAGTLVESPCPFYIYGGTLDHVSVKQGVFSTKKCRENGTWGLNAEATKEWTDYSTCITYQLGEQRLKLIVGIVAFSISVSSIIPALVIFSVYRSLSCPSNKLHQHLFLSLLGGGVLYIFNSLFFMLPGAPGENLISNNHVACRILFALQLRYFRSTSYSWMLCEGWYLHRLLVAAFEESHSLLPYYLLGWGFPLLPTFLDSLLRYIYEEGNCWISPMTKYPLLQWVHMAPSLLFLTINFGLMLSIVIILVKKLQFSSGGVEPTVYKKAVRASLILLPVFGLHFIFTIYRVDLLPYEIFNVLLDGLQGFVVVTLLCYTNHKVIEALKRTIVDIKETRAIRSETRRRSKVYRRGIPRLDTTTQL